MAKQIRVLLAHARGEESDQIEAQVEFLRDHFAGQPVSISTARHEWQTRLGFSGSADQLMVDLGAGVTLGGEPLFHHIVCPRPYVGKRTQAIVNAALRARRHVWYMEDDTLIPVCGINAIDPDEWTAGWQLVEKAESNG